MISQQRFVQLRRVKQTGGYPAAMLPEDLTSSYAVHGFYFAIKNPMPAPHHAHPQQDTTAALILLTLLHKIDVSLTCIQGKNK